MAVHQYAELEVLRLAARRTGHLAPRLPHRLQHTGTARTSHA
jgi:hypothetical protein